MDENSVITFKMRDTELGRSVRNNVGDCDIDANLLCVRGVKLRNTQLVKYPYDVCFPLASPDVIGNNNRIHSWGCSHLCVQWNWDCEGCAVPEESTARCYPGNANLSPDFF